MASEQTVGTTPKAFHKPKTSHETPDHAAAEQLEPAATGQPDAVTLTQAQLDKLGGDFMRSQLHCEEIESEIEAAREAKSVAVTAIVSALGHKGPYTIGGRTWMATKVKGQGEAGGKFTMREVAASKVTMGG